MDGWGRVGIAMLIHLNVEGFKGVSIWASRGEKEEKAGRFGGCLGSLWAASVAVWGHFGSLWWLSGGALGRSVRLLGPLWLAFADALALLGVSCLPL